MSMHKIHGEFIVECDLCDETFETGKDDFYDAVAEKKREGWSSRKDKNEWNDVCPKCGHQ